MIEKAKQHIFFILIAVVFFSSPVYSLGVSANFPDDVCYDVGPDPFNFNISLEIEDELTDVNAVLKVPSGFSSSNFEQNFSNISSDINLSFEVSCENPVAKTHSFSFDLNSNERSDLQNYELTLSTLASISSFEPLKVQNTSSFNLAVSTQNAVACKFSQTDVGYYGMSNSLSKIDGGSLFEKEVTGSEGKNDFYISCIDENEVPLPNIKREVIVDTTPPVITIDSPVGIVADSSQIRIVTDEKAVCRFDDEDISFEDMGSSLSTSKQIIHTKSLSSFSQGYYVFFAKCRDNFGNVQSDGTRFAFEISNPPSARVIVESLSRKKNVVAPGIVEIVVQTSKDLVGPPEFSYLIDEKNSRRINLEGSGDRWEGSILLDDTTSQQVGRFSFEGTDKSGQSGSVITSGGSFIVDGASPERIRDIEIRTDNDRNIRITWDGVDFVDEYNIYRATDNGVSRIDFLDDTSDTTFRDRSLEPGVTYYYRISGVSLAGNEGPLSDIVSETVPVVEVEEENTGLSESLIPLVNDVLVRAEDLKDSFENSRSLQSSNQFAFSLLDLDEVIGTNLGEVNSIIQSLNELKDRQLTREGLVDNLDDIKTRIQVLNKDVIEDVVIQDSFEASFESTQSRITRAVGGQLDVLRLSLDDDQRGDLIARATDLQSQISNMVYEITPVQVRYSDSSDNYFAVRKSFDFENLDGVEYIVEFIPEQLASSETGVVFKDVSVNNVQEGLVYSMGSADMSELIYYGEFSGDVSEIAVPVSVILPSFDIYRDDVSTEYSDGVGDFSFFGLSFMNLNDYSFFSVLFSNFEVLAGLILFVFLGIYYFCEDGFVVCLKSFFGKSSDVSSAKVKKFKENIRTIHESCNYFELDHLMKEYVSLKESLELESQKTQDSLLLHLENLRLRLDLEKIKASDSNIKTCNQLLTLANGEKISDTYHLAYIISKVNKKAFFHKEKDRLESWLIKSAGLGELAFKVKQLKNYRELENIVLEYNVSNEPHVRLYDFNLSKIYHEGDEEKSELYYLEKPNKSSSSSVNAVESKEEAIKQVDSKSVQEAKNGFSPVVMDGSFQEGVGTYQDPNDTALVVSEDKRVANQNKKDDLRGFDVERFNSMFSTMEKMLKHILEAYERQDRNVSSKGLVKPEIGTATLELKKEDVFSYGVSGVDVPLKEAQKSHEQNYVLNEYAFNQTNSKSNKSINDVKDSSPQIGSVSADTLNTGSSQETQNGIKASFSSSSLTVELIEELIEVKKEALKEKGGEVLGSERFFLKNGATLGSLYDLVLILKDDEDIFSTYVDSEKDDFASWVSSVLHLPHLASSLKSIKNREEYVLTILREVK